MTLILELHVTSLIFGSVTLILGSLTLILGVLSLILGSINGPFGCVAKNSWLSKF